MRRTASVMAILACAASALPAKDLMGQSVDLLIKLLSESLNAPSEQIIVTFDKGLSGVTHMRRISGDEALLMEFKGAQRPTAELTPNGKTLTWKMPVLSMYPAFPERSYTVLRGPRAAETTTHPAQESQSLRFPDRLVYYLDENGVAYRWEWRRAMAAATPGELIWYIIEARELQFDSHGNGCDHLMPQTCKRTNKIVSPGKYSGFKDL